MSNFKIGDQVEVTDPNSWAFGYLGEITDAPNGVYIVRFPTNNAYITGYFYAPALEYPKQLPLGQQQITFAPIHAKQCDCGGLKTYGSMTSENHSSWCSSRGNN